MKLRSSLFILAAVVIAPAAHRLSGGLAANTPPQNLEQMANDLSVRMASANIKRVGVLEFQSKDDLGGSLVRERLTTFLVNAGKVEVIERNLLDRFLKEKNLQQTGLIDEKTTTEMGKVLGVNAVITGSLTPLPDKSTEVNARVIESKTARIVAAGRANLGSSSPRLKPWARETKRADLNLSGPLLGKPLVQLAILLDTSNSMDGLIKQTKTQLWKIINELSSAEREGKNPEIEVALYEYGNDNLNAKEGYTRQVLPFTQDLDKVSEALFALRTNGGSEYAGKAIDEAVGGLTWKKYRDVYKVVFIAGNEPFTQGPIAYDASIRKAAQKGIIINTIFCGRMQQGRATGWERGAIIGHGEYMNIEHQMRLVKIEAPQDTEIQKLGRNINSTYIPYGKKGRVAQERQRAEDANAMANEGSAAMTNRSIFKSKKQYNQGTQWDLVTMVMNGKVKLEDIKREHLPAQLQKKSKKDLAKYINERIAERKKMSARIDELSKDRRKHIAKERAKTASSDETSLDDAMGSSIRKQAEARGYTY